MKIRTYVDRALNIGHTFELPPNVYHHVIKVLRLAVNAEFFIFNGQGGDYKAQIISVDKKKAVIQLTEFFANPTIIQQPINLVQAISRGDRMDFTLQKAVELGVNEITPIFSENGKVKLQGERLQKKLRHWHEIIVSATEQCGRPDLAKLNPPQSFIQLVSTEDNHSHKLILDPSSSKGFGCLKNTRKPIKVMIGPESGFTRPELDLAQQYNFKALKIGPRILRTETAAMAAITTIQVLFGDIT